MGGNSTRFFNAGYKVQKYRLEINGKTMFHCVLSAFREFFFKETFLFIVKPDEREFVIYETQQLGIQKVLVIELYSETRGQADTVAYALEKFHTYEQEPLIIFNIDTLRHNLRIPPNIFNDYSGFLEVFMSTGNNWSFIKPEIQYLPYGKVLQTTEKYRISPLCSTGLYGFKSVSLFKKFFKMALEKNLQVNGEYYIAPMYNLLIEHGHKIGYYRIDNKDISLCGTPLEYTELIKKIKRKLEFNNS